MFSLLLLGCAVPSDPADPVPTDDDPAAPAAPDHRSVRRSDPREASSRLRAADPTRFEVRSLNSAGDLHTPFGGDGLVSTTFSGYEISEIRGGAAAAGGGLVMGGYAIDTDTDNYVWALAKYTSTGALDTGFAGDGRYTAGWSGAEYTMFNDLKIAGGKVYAVGSARFSGHDRMAIAKYDEDTGALDEARYVTFPGYASAAAYAIAISGSEIIVGGVVGADNLNHDRIAMVKLATSDLHTITSFGTSGQTAINIAGDEVLADLQIDTSTNPYRIVAGGVASYGASGTKFWVARYNSNGVADATFNGIGIAVTDFDGLNEGINSIAVKDGKVLAVGWYTPSDTRFAIARYTSSGALDTTCAGNGIKGISWTGGYAVADFVTWGSSRITIAGWADVSDAAGYDTATAVLMGNDCSLDTGFDGNGLRLLDQTEHDDVGALVTGSFIYLGGR